MVCGRGDSDLECTPEGRVAIEDAVADRLLELRATLAVAESCTGGLIGKRLTDLPGASRYFLGGVIAYADEIKRRQLEVPAGLLREHGAVSAETAAAMAGGLRRLWRATYALSISGIAGPGGGSDQKPVGLIFTAVAGPGGTSVRRHLLSGSREQIRGRGSLQALGDLRLVLEDDAARKQPS